MAVEAEKNKAAVELNEEREGDHVESENLYFTKIGEPVPLKAENSSFDLQSHPVQPLAVSESSQAIFVAHSGGFYVAKTRDLIEAAKEIGEKKSGACIEEVCVVDVPIGRVRVLALSSDSSTLAACVGSQIHFYYVSALLKKERVPCFSCSVDESSHVKDFHWRKNSGSSYVVLSKSGVLYRGKVGGKLKEVMDNVDAVDWSVKGTYIVVARENVLTVLSSKFRERFSMSLMSDSWINGSDSSGNVKVDCIKWVRPDCILLGCLRLAEGGAEDGYFIQIISSKNEKIAKTASESVVLSFSEVFAGIIDDILPSGSGPYLFFSYLEHWGLAFVANQKNTDQHIVLFGWSLNDDQKEGSVIELSLADRWLPRIGLQENEDDNLIMGLAVDKATLYEKVMVEVGVEQKELSPFCLLLCLTLDGKLAMFYVASVAENQDPPQINPVLSEEEEEEEEDIIEAVPLGDDKLNTALRFEENEQKETVLESRSKDTNWQELTVKGDAGVVVEKEHPIAKVDSCLESSSIPDVTLESFNRTQGSLSLSVSKAMQKTQNHLEVAKKGEQSDANLGIKSWMTGQQSSSLEPNNSSFLHGFDSLHRTGSQVEAQKPLFPQTKTDSSAMPLFSPILSNSEVPLGRVDTDKQFPRRIDSIGSRGSLLSELPSSRKISSSDEPKVRSSPLSLSSSVVNQFENSEPRTRNNVHASASQASFDLPHENLFKTKEPTSIFHPLTYSSSIATDSGQRSSAGVLKFEAASAARSLKVPSHGNSQSWKSQPPRENLSNAKPSGLLKAEREISKHFASVRDMANELDILLSYIEDDGGFRDASIVFHKSSILSLERGLENLSGRCKVLKNTMEHRHEEIRLLLDKVVQVMTRTTYLEGIFKRASDSQYRDLWYRQKLSPELEMKQKRMLKLNQDLINQLVQLERHFHSIEVNRFSENSGGYVFGRVSHTGQAPSRRNQSVQSLYSATNSQLAAAECLSEYLTKQMSLLNIDSVKKRNVAKELFDSIGLEYGGETFKSPIVENVSHSPDSANKIRSHSSSFSITNKFGSRRPSLTNGSELDSTRRRRDSLDQNWANFEPSKTTIKRLSLQGERIRTREHDSFLMGDKRGFTSPSPLQPVVDGLQGLITPRHLDSSITVHEPNKVQPVHGESSKHPFTKTSYFKLAGVYAGPSLALESNSPALQVSQRKSVESSPSVVSFQSTRNEFQEKTSEAWGPIFNSLNGEGNFGGRSDSSKSQSVPFLKLTSDFQSKLPQDQTPTTSTRSPAQKATSPMTFSDVTSIQDSYNIMGGASQTKTAGPIKITSGNTSDLPNKSHPSPFSAVSSFLTVPISDVNIFQLGNVAGKSYGNTVLSASAASAQGTYSSSLQQQPPFLSSTVMSFGGSKSTTKPSTDVIQTISLPTASATASSSVSFPSSIFSTSTPNKQVSALPSSASMNMTLQIPPTKPEPEPVPVPTPVESKIPAVSEDSRSLQGGSGSKSAVNATSQVSPFQLELRREESNSDLAVSTTPTSESKIPAHLESGSTPSFTNLFSASSVSLNSQTELTSATQVPKSEEHHPSSPSATDEKNVNLDLADAQEDEMEEEAPDTSTDLNLGSLGGFSLGSAPSSSLSKPNPFGVSVQNTAGNPSAFSFTVPTGEMFRPASFNLQSVQPSQPAPTMNQNPFAGSFSSSAQGPTGSGFGQPAQLGPGQHAMGSVLGGFGQSRQLGMGTGFTSASGFGGGFPAPSSGGFANAAAGGGFAGLGSAGSGFAASASGVTGFAAAAASGPGFANAAGGVGFAGAASAGGGFGAFGNKQGSGGFPTTFGSNSMGGGKPPPQLLTQMRK